MSDELKENVDTADSKQRKASKNGNPNDFHVSGPRNLPMPAWKSLITSSWTNDSYKRAVIACFIQAVYVLELDRQGKHEGDAALAPHWWKPFKYKLSNVLVDPKDRSIFGAVFECNHLIARPRKAPKAVIAFRGNLLRYSTIMRDIHDDLRVIAMNDLSGSCRFKLAMETVRGEAKKHGAKKICMAGHSLGAKLALQVGKALVEEDIVVEAHLFNPPSITLPGGLRSLRRKLEYLWHVATSPLRMATSTQANESEESSPSPSDKETPTTKDIQQRWVSCLYVNQCDYICCHYTSPSSASADNRSGKKPKAKAANKVFIVTKGPTKFSEAHGIQQWWADDFELQMALTHLKRYSTSSLPVSFSSQHSESVISMHNL